MTITFYASDRTTAVSGYDLTVTVYKPAETFPITIGAAAGGTVASSVGGASASCALYEDVVTLTATPASGYLLNDIIVTDADNNSVATLGAWYTGNTATFTMPNVAVTVSPTFTTAKTSADGLYIRMPKNGSVNDGIIPEGVQSFKVYDDGGASAPYSAGSNGTLTLTAPTGYILRMKGSIVGDNGARLNVYDGSDTDAAKLIDNAYSGNVLSASTGQSITIQYTAGSNDGGYAGLDLTVNLTTPDAAYAIGIDNPAAGGTVTASVGGAAATSASAGQTVTLTSAPANGYLLSAISVTDEVGHSVALTDMRWHTGTNTATFTMPVSAVSIVPTFTDNWTADGGLYINMPATGSRATTIPDGVQSFKVYDDGGADGFYSNNCNGILTLTAPAGCVLQLTGSVTTMRDDALTVYDNSEASGTKLLDAVGSSELSGDLNDPIPVPAVTTSSNAMTLCFYSDEVLNFAGLDLTVTLIRVVSLENTNDNSTVINDNNGKQVDVTLTGRTLYKDGAWNTLVLPFAVDVNDAPLSGTGVVAMTLDAATSGVSGQTLTLNFTEAETIAAGTPFIIKWDTADEHLDNPTFSGVTIDADHHDPTTSDGSVTFTGIYAPKNIGSDGDNTLLYLGTGNTLYWPNATMNIGAFRAYFQLNEGITAGNPADPQSAGVRAFVLNFGDEETAIKSLSADAKDFSDGGAWYTLDGRQLNSKPTKSGIYVNNGKKVVIK